MTARAGPSWMHSSSSSEDETEIDTSKRMKYSLKEAHLRKKLTQHNGEYRGRPSLERKSACIDEDSIEPCKSPQGSESEAGDSDHVEDFDDNEEMNHDFSADTDLDNISNGASHTTNFGARPKQVHNDVNQGRTLHLQRKTVIYGQTPVAIRKSQLADMAQASGMSIKKFAEYILRCSTKEKLECLQMYHTSNLHQLSLLFEALESCQVLDVDEKDSLSHCHPSMRDQSHTVKFKRQNNLERTFSSNMGKAVSKRHPPRLFDKKISTAQNPIKCVTRKQVTVIPDTESDQSDGDCIPPSPESSYSHIYLKRSRSSEKRKGISDSLVDGNRDQFPTRNNSSTSTVSSLFEPLIEKDISDSTISELDSIKQCDYNPVLDELFDEKESSGMKNDCISIKHKPFSNKQKISQGSRDYNCVLDTILFGEPLYSSTQLQTTCSTPQLQNPNENEKDVITQTKCNQKQNVNENKGSEIDVQDTVPSSLELAQTPWSNLEHLFDD